MKMKLKKINDYIYYDYGIDIYKMWQKICAAIKNSIVIRVIFDFLILIGAILLAICWAGSVFALLLSHPAFIVIFLMISILILLFALEPEYVYELIKRN